MEYAVLILSVFAAYILFCKLWPYFLYPNYFLPSKIERYPELVELASRLRDNDKFQTIQNVYAYMQQTYTGEADSHAFKNILTVFKLGDFSTKELLNKKQFLWCHTQNRLFKSILVNTGAFKERDVVIRNELLRSVYIHQWVELHVNGKKIKIDPHCGIFETR